MTWRGELAGYTGTLILEEVDEDEHVARHRFQGTRDGATATATITTGASGLSAEVHRGHGSDLTAGELVAAVGEVWSRAEDGEAPASAESPDAARRRRTLVAAGAAAALAAWALKGRR
jgi:hypothetical protein